MQEKRASIEIIAPTVEEAVERGAAELGLPQEALEVEVLDEGGKGLFGLGNRQARVRLSLRDAASAPPRPEPAAEPLPSAEEDDEALRVSREIVTELLERMGTDARVLAVWGPTPEPGEPRPLMVDIRGRDLSVLIGRKGETLQALQYITRLIVAKELGRPESVVIDVEGYRERRERQLRQLARRMASQAVEYGRTMSLEPMSPADRRIIHLELRDHEGVRTESVGEGDRRKVTIIPRAPSAD
jgi:spoIIIJ-associated protein